MNIDYKKYWQSDSLKNLTVNADPEGFCPIVFTRDILSEIPSYNQLLDIGCGTGRLCQVVPSEKYIGVDLNENAIRKAKDINPNYLFMEVDVDSDYPTNDVVLAYTVFLHMDDGTLNKVINNIRNSKNEWILIVEILGREWRRSGDPPAFNRDMDDYLKIMRGQGYELYAERHSSYKYYPNVKDKNTNLNALLFKRRETS